VTFANPLPLWAIAAALAGFACVAWLAYRRIPIAASRRHALSALRFTTLLWIGLCLMRPVGAPIDGGPRDAIVPILVDTSRSMGLADAGGARRIERARDLIDGQLLPALAPRFHTEVLRFGDRVAETDPDRLAATDRHTSLGAALQAVHDRYRGRPVAGIVLVSDGGDNGGVDPSVAAASGATPIFAFGIGPRAAARDREVVSVTAAESVMSDAMVDVTVSADRKSVV